jgi:hypothetical protein
MWKYQKTTALYKVMMCFTLNEIICFKLHLNMIKIGVFRCEEHLYTRLRPLVGWSIRWSVRPPRCNYVENWLRRDCFERRRRKRKLITSRFHYVAIPSHLGIRRSPCFFLKKKQRKTFRSTYLRIKCSKNIVIIA